MRRIYSFLLVCALFAPLMLSCSTDSDQTGGDDPAGQNPGGGETPGGNNPGGEDPADPDNPGRTEETVTATLSFSELSNPSDYVAGYGNPRDYTNESGTWNINAYRGDSYFQLNEGKSSWIRTPLFDKAITKVRITTSEERDGKFYLCSVSGNTQPDGILLEAQMQEGSTELDASALNRKQLWIRAGALARITAVEVTVGDGGSQPDNPDTPDNPDSPDNPDPGQPDNPDPGAHTAGGWYELPVITDADHNGIDDNDANIYYASHSFQNGTVTWRNYTTCFSATDHCAFWVAAPRHSVYESGVSRKDAYRADPDIPADIQYRKKSADSGCNNGHMLGSAERLMNRECNNQVFYFSNIAPQLQDTFNTGNGAWNNLEDFVDGQVVSDTLYVVIGCYFKDYTDAYGKTCTAKKISFGGRSDVSFPTMMYYVLLRTKAGNSRKAVSDCSADELQCAAFVLRHDIEKGHEPQRSDMMTVRELEKITGFSYFANVPNAPKGVANASEWGL